ncbi:hypothetical protein CDD80_4561 [Ophiocordyceps camponoti-rufipedis]|uniref:Uncharacterized protein n=1 Tax=Ophiocordyceps camponoti-rufipedis TaxID=2004952 RepID=A0A2C5YY14_9HYPO|nr:hypothetical protein CDD80_4561 [Ophiocordyceps camponoti-rufipedis]
MKQLLKTHREPYSTPQQFQPHSEESIAVGWLFRVKSLRSCLSGNHMTTTSQELLWRSLAAKAHATNANLTPSGHAIYLSGKRTGSWVAAVMSELAFDLGNPAGADRVGLKDLEEELEDVPGTLE